MHKPFNNSGFSGMRAGAGAFWLLPLALSALACGPDSKATSDADVDTLVCIEGEQSCDGLSRTQCIDNSFQAVEECDEGCTPGLGCTLCSAGEHTCDGDTLITCTPDGNGYDEFECDAMQGMQCSEQGCTGACSPNTLGTNYIGCEYFPTVTANIVQSNPFRFAVSISNTQGIAANVTIGGANLVAPITFTVPPNDVVVQSLDWVMPLKDNTSGASRIVAAGSYHLRSDQPVTVYQFSPLNYEIGSAASHTNDASLLYPSNALGMRYRVASWPKWSAYPGLMAITAAHDDTSITVTTKADVALGDMPPITASVPQQLTLNRGDVLELLPQEGDLTGSEVTSDKPVQVIGGHACTNIPADLVACDHLEEVMLPVEVLGTNYVVAAPAVTSLPAPKVRTIRVVATEADTTLSFDPPVAGVPLTLAVAGDFAEITSSAEDISIQSNKRVLVAEYMNGRGAGLDDEGDPALTVAPPVEQFRSSYLFHAPPSYESNFVSIVSPTGAAITLDGTAVTAFTPVGSSGYSVARVLLGPGIGGNHDISGDQAFGISVYGYGFATSYWYPGGLNLTPIPID